MSVAGMYLLFLAFILSILGIIEFLPQTKLLAGIVGGLVLAGAGCLDVAHRRAVKR